MEVPLNSWTFYFVWNVFTTQGWTLLVNAVIQLQWEVWKCFYFIFLSSIWTRLDLKRFYNSIANAALRLQCYCTLQRCENCCVKFVQWTHLSWGGYARVAALYPHDKSVQWVRLDPYDECCGKIDLFRVQNRVVHILPWWVWWVRYIDTKYMTVLRTEQILHNFEDQKFANFFNLEQVNFCVTLILCVSQSFQWSSWETAEDRKLAGVSVAHFAIALVIVQWSMHLLCPTVHPLWCFCVSFLKNSSERSVGEWVGRNQVG